MYIASDSISNTLNWIFFLTFIHQDPDSSQDCWDRYIPHHIEINTDSIHSTPIHRFTAPRNEAISRPSLLNKGLYILYIYIRAENNNRKSKTNSGDHTKILGLKNDFECCICIYIWCITLKTDYSLSTSSIDRSCAWNQWSISLLLPSITAIVSIIWYIYINTNNTIYI